MRYVGLINRSNAGEPDCQLAVERAVLFEMLSAAAGDALAPSPTPVDERQLIYRIDLRDYGWNAATRVGSVDYSDSWEAIAGSSRFAVPFVGDEADDVVSSTGSTVPFLFASALIEQLTSGVPPSAAAPVAALRSTPQVATALARLSAPVVLADVAGDLGVSSEELARDLNLLPAALAPLATGGTLERAVYAPLFLPSLCAISMPFDNQPDPNQCG